MKNANRGFTLIELLVVIAVIGLLASIVNVALSSARVKARDTRRVADLKQIRNALELYQQDNGHYPIPSTWSCFDCVYYINTAIINPAAVSISAALAPYMSGTPKDPKRTADADSGYLYNADGNGVDFKLMAWRTPENMNNFSTNLIDYSRCNLVVNGQCAPGYVNTVGFWTPGGANY